MVHKAEQQRRHVQDRDGAVAEVHLGGGRHTRHRLAQRFGDDLLAVDEYAQNHRLDVLLVHDVARDGQDRLGLITGRTRHRCRLVQWRGIGRRGRPGDHGAAGEGETHRDHLPARQTCAQALILDFLQIAHDVLLRFRQSPWPEQAAGSIATS